VTPRLKTWCSTSELPRPGPAPVPNPCTEHSLPTVRRRGKARRGPDEASRLLEKPGSTSPMVRAAYFASGSRTHFDIRLSSAISLLRKSRCRVLKANPLSVPFPACLCAVKGGHDLLPTHWRDAAADDDVRAADDFLAPDSEVTQVTMAQHEWAVHDFNRENDVRSAEA
jgi:hypothetical protein